MFKQLLIIYTGFSLAFLSCKVDPKIVPALPVDGLVAVVPEGWPQPVYTFSDNPITENTFVLGRSLFYETLLSADNTISCGSCHQIAVAFAHADHRVSHGIEQREGIRNSPGLFNLAWHTSFMHDGGVLNIERQPFAPITNTVEMGESVANVVAKLQASAKYRSLFNAAFGSEEVTSEKMAKSMAQFMGLIYSYDTRYDYYKQGRNNVQFTAEELRGYELFKAKCNSCHAEPLFSDFKFRNNGLKVNPNPLLVDSGRMHITQQEEDRYKFKTPSLRNVALSYPYMHDGTLKTLEECLDHYTNGIVNMTNLDHSLQGGIPMTAAEKKDIIAFLHTLTDYKIIRDRRFMDPNFN